MSDKLANETDTLNDEKQSAVAGHVTVSQIDGDNTHEHHVDVHRGVEAFQELSRQLTIRSEAANHHQQSISSASTAASGLDVEKGKGDAQDAEPFDLLEYLASSNDAYQQAGIKHKARCSSARFERIFCLLICHDISMSALLGKTYRSMLWAALIRRYDL